MGRGHDDCLHIHGMGEEKPVLRLRSKIQDFAIDKNCADLKSENISQRHDCAYNSVLFAYFIGLFARAMETGTHENERTIQNSRTEGIME